jgi:membrane protease subunit (stomatin/prohibitin family)
MSECGKKGPNRKKEIIMTRRRPVARLAVGTAAVAGAAGAVSSRRANQEQAEAQAAAEDPYTQLEKLGQLHKQGILTDSEFAARKAMILA